MQTGEQVEWWESAECAPYKELITKYTNFDYSDKAYNENLVNDPLFWRCNYSFELDNAVYLRDLYRSEAAFYNDMSNELTELKSLYGASVVWLGILLLFLIVLAVVAWRMAHQRRVKGFQAYHMDRLAMVSHTYDRDAVAKIRASIDREVEESKKPFPYLFGVRDQYPISLEQCAATANAVQDSVREYLRPHEQVKLDEERINLELRRRNDMITQDLRAEVPRFVREQLRRQHQFEQNRWMAAKSEISQVRQTLIATVTELRENPALQSKLGMVIDAMKNLSDTMNNLRDSGTVEDDQIGEYLDHLITRVTEEHIGRSTGTTFHAN